MSSTLSSIVASDDDQQPSTPSSTNAQPAQPFHPDMQEFEIFEMDDSGIGNKLIQSVQPKNMINSHKSVQL